MSTNPDPTTELLTAAGALDPDLPTDRIVTHGAVVFLNGTHAWKMKRPVRLRFFDFSSPELRHDVLQQELTLNRRFAPEVYRAVHAIRRADDGSLTLDGPGETVDWVLEMTRFDDDALLVHRAEPGNLDDAFLRTLAESVVDLHASSPIRDDPYGAARLQEVVDGNLASMSAFPDVIDPAAARRLTSRITAMITERSETLDARARRGRVRRVHGDLHLGNIAIIDGRPVPFDCLEFDEEMATTDVLYDLAFLLMDLWARDLRHEANVVVNQYLDRSPDDEDGFCLLPIMLAVRATVRAHVSAAADAADDATRYLSLALGFTEPVAPRLMAIGGGSGTGKTTVARAIGGDLEPAPGARILRTDVLRKRLAGVGETEKLPRSAYTPQARSAVYDELNRLATTDLAGGMSVVADAVFGSATQQQAIAAVATETGVDFTGWWLELDEAERISRITHRGPDASDADESVARRQTATLEPPDEWTHVDAHADPSFFLRNSVRPQEISRGRTKE
ncbi:AAA family ATPase [Gordonia polyisoprenivorans]|uniref:bifunctional aminoglycoside phosphotransferase/ATP-binding protein n=1 Tax=Gordonia polyisoprenivorans TaxID=84595 RepID=UPI000B99D711|nr:AAA family ATPase [Gordonia polyisoprenivorans]MBE7192096.1 AAA family ATPase [Gordonia polyisoprenivorans]OZC32255.1 aminoglycoside phosphotransferase [Gordonia polyisoprenivorans]UZF55636.1 AAA family ATPase [Gordonia polyisoprenivorans]